jgi:flavorubredoxin
MTLKQMRPGINMVGAVDWDRRLFDALIPLPDGTSYNSYLVKGSEKTALIDTVDPAMKDVLLNNLEQLEVERIDYVIANHAEQDHSGTIPVVLNKYPEAKVVCTAKCKGMLIDLLEVSAEKFITVEDRETISLGDRTLEFIHAPWVHWPETMLTYLKEEKILFSCDLFGSHLAASDLYVTDISALYDSARRYFAEIMMPFRVQMRKNLNALEDYEIDMIAPSHGPVHDKPGFIMQAYHSWAFDNPKNIVVLAYVSMHGSTREMVKYLVRALAGNGITVKQFDLTVADIGKLAMSLVDAATVVIGTPTVLAGAHPNVAYAAMLANALRPDIRFLSIIGSYGWGGKAVEQLAGLIPNLKAEVLSPVLSKGFPGEADFQALDKLATTIAQKHKENGFS